MFSKDTYIRRRAQLKQLTGNGVIILFGNNEAPCNYPANAYYPFRQDSSFLYYFGAKRDGLIGVIDIDHDTETLIGDDIDIDDIVWYGSVNSVADLAAQAGVAHTAPMKAIQQIFDEALKQQRTIHFLPPYRHDTMIQIHDLLGIHPSQQRAAASLTLIQAVVKMRSTKEPQEIAELERAQRIGYEMQTTARRTAHAGRYGRAEREIHTEYPGGGRTAQAPRDTVQDSKAGIYRSHGISRYHGAEGSFRRALYSGEHDHGILQDSEGQLRSKDNLQQAL